MAKSVKGAGTFIRLKNGDWKVKAMDGYQDNGKKNYVTFTAPTKSEARHLLSEYLENKNNTPVPFEPATLFSDWADTWYKDYESQVAASTYAGYVYTLNLLKDYFKDLSGIEPLTS